MRLIQNVTQESILMEMSLHAAARANDVDIVTQLLHSDDSIKDDRTDGGLTALHICATHGCYDVAVVLLQYGGNIHLRDFENGWTALHRSIYFRNLKISLLLIKAGALLGDSITGTNAWRADIKAREKGHVDKSDESNLDNDGYSPLDLLSATLSSGLAKSKVAKECTTVVAFGKADFQLGVVLPYNNRDVLRARRVDSLQSSNIVMIGAAKYHSCALSKAGELYMWGHGRGGRLGHGDEATHPEPRLLHSLRSHMIVSVSVAENHSLALSSLGDVFSWGSDRFGQLGHGAGEGSCTPRRVMGALKKCKVVGIAASDTHSVCYDSQNDVYAWGCNKSGQLGLIGSSINTPHLVTLPGSSKKGTQLSISILQITAGHCSTLLLRSSQHAQNEHDVFQWGFGSQVPARVNFHANRDSSPQRSSSFSGSNKLEMQCATHTMGGKLSIVQIASGKYHHVALSSEGRVYTWGFGSDQLGHGPAETHVTYPQLVEKLLLENGGGKIVSICASSHTNCCISDCGDLYSWGSTPDQGVLGHGNVNFQPVPKRVIGVKRAVSVACGANHTLVLLSATMPLLPLSAQPPALLKRDATPVSLSGLSSSDSDSDSDDDDTHLSEPDPQFEEHAESEPATSLAVGLPELYSAPTLKQLCERSLAQSVNIKNAISLLAHAEILDANLLAAFCVQFIECNFDAILVSSKPSDLDVLMTDVDLSVKYTPYASYSSSGPMDKATSCTKRNKASMAHARPASDSVKDERKGRTGSVGSVDGHTTTATAAGSSPSESFRRDRAPSKDLDTIQGVTKLIRSVKKKLNSVLELETKIREMGSSAAPMKEQLEKIERKHTLQSELKRLSLILVRLEAESRISQMAAAKRIDMKKSDEVQPAAASEPDTKSSAAAGASKVTTGTPTVTAKKAPVSALTKALIGQPSSAPPPTVPIAPPSFNDWEKMVTTPKAPVEPTLSLAAAPSPWKTVGSAGAGSSPLQIPKDKRANSSATHTGTPTSSGIGSATNNGSVPSPNLSASFGTSGRTVLSPGIRGSSPVIGSPVLGKGMTLASFLPQELQPAKSTGSTPKKWAVASSSSTPIANLSAILQEEERVRAQSDTKTLSGNDSPWFIERRPRADSLENILKIQELEKEFAKEEERERERKKRGDSASSRWKGQKSRR